MMNCASDMPTGMMVGMGIVWILILAWLVLSLLALVKYLRSG
ncbi:MULTISPECIES: hypothetical protein [Stakelama]|uniref:Uncharacterized protein n=2 Tax=Stakelama TaxID=1124625 RepID=A0A4R6FUA1_9SPHN|nr:MULTISPECIES: hypothetical protein [Stakelama]TDN85332.1 hypothetical protein EV664_10237 [Stakelama pacifica]WNO53510.1 hypothetical protein RPR59_13865 [Stakelama sp. W311]